MRHTTLLRSLALFILIGSLGCGQAERSANLEPMIAHDQAVTGGNASAGASESLMAVADSAALPAAALSSNAARTPNDSTRRFIRTGDLRFLTNDVIRTSFAIEALVTRQGGHVEHTHMASQVNQRYTTPISEDSLLETTKYTVVNQLTLRVPQDRLDTTLKSLIAFVDHLDHRTLSATDVRLQLLRDQLAQRRLAAHQRRMRHAIDQQDGKRKGTVSAEDHLLDRQEQQDAALLNTLELEDRIAFSTITLDIHQRERIRHTLLPNGKNIDAYEPGFLAKAKDALIDGWDLLVDVVLLLLRSWSTILILVVGFVLVRRLFWRKKGA